MANTLTFANQTLTDADIFGGISFLADLNTGEEFSIGNTASSSVSFVTETQLPLYSQDSTNGTFTWTRDNVSRGRYYITEVTKAAGKYTVTAYDAMILLDAKITSLSLSYPITVSAIASAIATYIGCTVSGTVNNGTISVSDLDDDMSIRQLLGYVAEASGCSVKIDGSGHLCFMYYADSGITITASQYKEFGLEVADYTCAAIDSVVIIDGAGTVVAQAGTGTNTLFIQGNPLLAEATASIAAVILDQVDGFAYAPLKCDMFEENGLEIGTIATFGTTASLVMHLESSESGALASSVGNASRSEYNKSILTLVNEAKAAADAAAKTATVYITEIDDNGIMVHAANNSASNYAKINANGMDIYKGGESVSSFGSSMRIGKTSCDDDEYPNSYITISKVSNAGTRMRFMSTNGGRHLGHIEAYNYITEDADDRNLIIMGPVNGANSPKIELQYNYLGGYYALVLDAGNSARQIFLDNDGVTINGPVVINGGSLADFVTSEGATSGWYYRKWKSGRVEAWGTVSPSASSGTSWGNSIRYYDVSVTIPSGIFSTAPIRAYATMASNQWWVVSVTSLTKTGCTVRLAKPTSSSQSATIHMYVLSF